MEFVEKQYKIGKIAQKYLITEISSYAFDIEDGETWLWDFSPSSRAFLIKNHTIVNRIMGEHLKSKLINSDNAENVIFLKTFKSCVHNFNANVTSGHILRMLQKYLNQNHCVKVTEFQIYYQIIEEKMADFVELMNWHKLKSLNLINTPTLP